VITSKSAPSVIYSAVVSTIDANRSPLLSAVVPVVIYGLRLTLDLPWQSTTANNPIRTGECVINLPGAETIAAIERLAQTVTSINKIFDFSFSRAVVCGTLTPAHMTLVPSEAISALRALECPMQLEARIEGSTDTMDHELIVPLDKSVTFGQSTRIGCRHLRLSGRLLLLDEPRHPALKGRRRARSRLRRHLARPGRLGRAVVRRPGIAASGPRFSWRSAEGAAASGAEWQG
jgi:flavin reductase (DIM6/NTAB) family NADH-FMN oxidoreductase RutF